ncbi:putative 54S ribosomal protein [Clavispora lusitaniae]|uniref:54S ribosomal protein n=1 Tax=Clavispora lusitaniae TaxID=36911 RepID=A0ACD0WKV9_CLALS|nr:hypothetical protein FOB63_005206 [Clavispora lusitaniae]QFZ27697.1 putative 54S ribosomal protein [Clavispora lusitaniae]QFZ32996.1 putative 54S ribosomal protein [Clavispora lusitaniae]QFZ38666.1 putative 54S ribosomal protein [Clavispora lusitaniae]QFZ44348.1 putative 54S ribosomal protein [Clavispora lusitaniae]
MSDRVARLSALRRSRKSEKIIVNEGSPDERDSSTTGEKLNENESSTKKETITPSEATTSQEATEEPNDQDTQHESKYDSAEATLSYNSDLKQDISLLLNKSQRATDNALKRIIQERFQEDNQI